MAREASTCDLKELVLKFIPESIGKDIEKVRITKLPSPPAPAPFTNLTCALAASTSGPLASRTAVSKKHIHTRASREPRFLVCSFGCIGADRRVVTGLVCSKLSTHKPIASVGWPHTQPEGRRRSYSSTPLSNSPMPFASHAEVPLSLLRSLVKHGALVLCFESARSRRSQTHCAKRRDGLTRDGVGVCVCCGLQSCAGIYPLQNVFLRKVKILKAPKFDVTKLMEVHGDFTEEIGTKVERSEPKGDQEELVGA